MYPRHALTIARYLQSKYESGLLDSFYWANLYNHTTGINLEMRATSIVFHGLIMPELLRFCNDYRLRPKTTYFRHDTLARAWNTVITANTCVPDDEIVRICVVLKDI